MDWQRLPFVIEVLSLAVIMKKHCALLNTYMTCIEKAGEELSKATHEYVAQAQNKSKNAFKASMAAAFTFFQSQLERISRCWMALQLRP